jgi:hypothetical protein
VDWGELWGFVGGYWRTVYRVSTDGLGKRLETWEPGLAGKAMVLAERIEASSGP